MSKKHTPAVASWCAKISAFRLCCQVSKPSGIHFLSVPIFHSHITEGSMDCRVSERYNSLSYHGTQALRVAYLLPADNNLCRCPALVIKWSCRYPLGLWWVTVKEGGEQKSPLRGLEKSQNEALLMRPGVTSICRLLKYGAERFSGRSEVVSLLLQLNPVASMWTCVSRETDLHWLCVTAWGTFFGSLKWKREGLNLWNCCIISHVMLNHHIITLDLMLRT